MRNHRRSIEFLGVCVRASVRARWQKGNKEGGVQFGERRKKGNIKKKKERQKVPELLALDFGR